MLEEKDMTETQGGEQTITRKEAIQKVGKYAAFTAAAMMLILDPAHAQPPKSPPEPPRVGKTQKKSQNPGPPPSF
jgi:hypothetical protein